MTDPAPAPEYVAARRVLLDALTALAPHRDAIVVAGAQAIYLHTGDADLDATIAAFTTDGDLAVNPSLLGDEPQLETIMRGAGFELMPRPGGHIEPGIWIHPTTVDGRTFNVPVDLIVPEALSGGLGRRGARLGAHGKQAARRAVGLEAALVDHATMTIEALEPSDTRSVAVNVAGIPALLIAKAHKLSDRLNTAKADRLSDKDAADVVRLMQVGDPRAVGVTMAGLASDPFAATVASSAVAILEDLFGRRGGAGIDLATRATVGAVPAARVEIVSIRFTQAMLDSYRASSAMD